LSTPRDGFSEEEFGSYDAVALDVFSGEREERCTGQVTDLMWKNARLAEENELLRSRCMAITANGKQHTTTERRGGTRAQRRKSAHNDSMEACLLTPYQIGSDTRTTVMLRNLPNNYTRSMFVAMLDSEGFQGLFDFVYLPIDFQTKACFGYAFVNLSDASIVPSFWDTFNGFSRWSLPSKKVCFLSWCGPQQGYDAYVERYRNSPIMHPTVPDEHRPVVFSGGVRVEFPPPTKVPRAPRIRDRTYRTAPNAGRHP
jgi:hypothetical protein